MLANSNNKINTENNDLQSISRNLENLSILIKNTKNKDFLKSLKNILKNLENDISDVENSLSIADSSLEKEQIYTNNTLLISELQNKVVLPYTFNDLENIFYRNVKYNSYEEIIEKLYTIPISYYKNSSISRFKEAYKLMRKKEKASIAESISLGLELSLNYSLNPAIITACKNLDELDIYLDCLSENELDKFNLFDIKYEILPHR